MKGILLAGGSGTRLFPLTLTQCKQLLPIYDKPTIYYPLSALMLAGIKDILIISTPRDLPHLQQLLGDGAKLGLTLKYKEQAQPRGIAEAFILAEDFIGNSPVCLILGDNIFYGHELTSILSKASQLKSGALLFGYRVSDPENFGVAEIDKNENVVGLEEKPKSPKSSWAVTGLYFYDDKVVSIAKGIKPSPRGELEITDVNKEYLRRGNLKIELFGRGVAWLDSGTPDSLLSASQFVQTLQKRQGLQIACLEEIALFKKFISKSQFDKLAEESPNSDYGRHLKRMVTELANL